VTLCHWWCCKSHSIIFFVKLYPQLWESLNKSNEKSDKNIELSAASSTQKVHMLSEELILKLFQMLSFRYKSSLCQSTNTEMFGFMARVTHDEPWLTCSNSAAQPQWTSTHQCTIHWMPVITQSWMNLNWVNILFHLGYQFCWK
jgi:hypothetical protein